MLWNCRPTIIHKMTIMSLILSLLLLLTCSHAFMNQPPPRGPPSNLFYGSGSGGDEELPPHPIVCLGNDNFEDYEDQVSISTNSTVSTQQVEVRGGGSSSSTEVVKGAKSLFPTLTKFWKAA